MKRATNRHNISILYTMRKYSTKFGEKRTGRCERTMVGTQEMPMENNDGKTIDNEKKNAARHRHT